MLGWIRALLELHGLLWFEPVAPTVRVQPAPHHQVSAASQADLEARLFLGEISLQKRSPEVRDLVLRAL